MKHIKAIIIFITLLTFYFPSFAQNKDSITIKHSPKKAALMSTFVPGLGQVYNKKYWKTPIIYAGLGTLTYFIINNNDQYNKFRLAYKYRTDSDPNTIDNLSYYSDEQLKINREYYRSNLELSVILTGALYLLNIVDASVDAHLFKFNISEDLSLHISPVLVQPNTFANNRKTGFSLKLNFWLWLLH